MYDRMYYMGDTFLNSGEIIMRTLTQMSISPSFSEFYVSLLHIDIYYFPSFMCLTTFVSLVA